MFNWLALGDSYTIGEGVMQDDSYPFQTATLLRKQGFQISTPLVIAKTGWTTNELKEAMSRAELKPSYDIVSLLIGVNNQYRGWSLNQYRLDFENLLKELLKLAGGHFSHVFVLSIPDWSVTPFAEGRDRNKISREIDQFNAANEEISKRFRVNYLDITGSSREAGQDLSLLVNDRLHPSAKEYAKWSVLLANQIREILK